MAGGRDGDHWFGLHGDHGGMGRGRHMRRFWLACLFDWVMSGLCGFSRLAIAVISASGEYMMVYCIFRAGNM